jgi:hypothetical protein
LPACSKILDIGGGIGSVSLSIAQKFPKLKFVIQDRPTIASQAEVVGIFFSLDVPLIDYDGSSGKIRVQMTGNLDELFFKV